MAINIDYIDGRLAPIKDNVIVSDMYFGEQKTNSGLIITSDDGDVRGIYPRWGKVYAKGPTNTDPYQVGDWVLIEHGRWTRAFKMRDGSETAEVRMVETSSILLYSDKKPDGVYIGKSSVADFQTDKISPESFIRG
jgi:co-chaperonin GroES (HSP10)